MDLSPAYLPGVEFDRLITSWAERTFPRRSSTKRDNIYGIYKHIEREVRELEDEIYTYLMEDGKDEQLIERILMECADIRILLNHLAFRLGDSLSLATARKFDELQTRVWGEPDEEGVIEHVRS